MDPLRLLFGTAAASSLPLPDELLNLYGGPLGVAPGALYANFVQSIDGVVAIRSVPSPGSRISGHSEADRFVMGLLRAAAEAVLVGAGTLRDAPGHAWTPAAIDPARQAPFAELRRRLGLPPDPRLVVVTASGHLDPGHPALANSLVLTTAHGATRLDAALPESCDVEVLPGRELLSATDVVGAIRRSGAGRILSEAGPTLTGQLLDAKLLGELFVTQSPVVIGGDRREARGLAGEAILPGGLARPARLLGVRRHGSHLFLQYRWEA